MYESYYHLKTKPFSLLPDPDFLYLGVKHKLALSLLEYGLLNQAGFIVITGEPGTGKTTLLQKIIQDSNTHCTIGAVSNTHDALGSLLPWILAAFDQEAAGSGAVELAQRFSAFLADEAARHHRVVLLIDEAQNLTPSMLEELRLLSNTTSGKSQLLQIVLSGQPALRGLLQRPDLTQFAQRVAVDYHLEPMAELDTIAYVRHRIQVAGGTHPIFTEHACRLLHQLTEGTPRLINQVADTALAYGFAEQQQWITAQLLGQAARDRSKGGILPLADRTDLFVRTSQQDSDELAEMKAYEAATRHSPDPPAEPGGSSTTEEHYERGMALRKAGMFKAAIEQFQCATTTPALAIKAYAQIGLCHKSSGRYEDAVAAFRQALKAPHGSTKETVQILYVLGRTLESLGRVGETLEAYRWIRREDPSYRDVATRINHLSSKRPATRSVAQKQSDSWIGGVLKSWHSLLREPK